MNAPATLYAVVWTRESAVESLDQRRIEMGMAMRELDDAIGQAAGTAAKYLGPSGIRGLGLDSVLKMSKAMGLRIVFEIDPEATARVADNRRPRRANQARPGNFAKQLGKRVKARVATVNGRLGGKARVRNQSPELRAASARFAALKRHYPHRVMDWNEIKRTAERAAARAVKEQ